MTTVEIWQRDHISSPGPPTKVADITERWGRSFRLAANDYGNCTLSVQLSDPQIGELVSGRLVKFVRYGVSYGFVLRDLPRRAVDESGKVAEVLKVNAPGVLAVGADGRCQPFGGVGWQPWARQRRWDWTNPLLDTSGWTAAVELWFQGISGDPAATNSDVFTIPQDQGRTAYNMPDGFLDGFAAHIWSTGYSGSAGTNGSGTLHMEPATSYFHKTFTVAEDMKARIIGGADDYMEAAVDGVVKITTSPAPEEAWSRARTADLLLSAGEHTIRCKVTNHERAFTYGNLASLVLSVHEVDPVSDAAGAVLVRTDDSWVSLHDPTDPPSMTAGEVLLSHLYEMQVAGFLTDLNPTFTADADSNEEPWPLVDDIVTTLGQGFDELLIQLAQAHIDFRVNHDLTVDAWVKGTAGSASGITYAVGVNVASLEFDGDQSPVSSLLIAHQDGTAVLGDASSGRQEFVDLSSLPEAQALAEGAVLLEELSADRWAVALTVEPAGADVPLDDLNVFDTAPVPTPDGSTDEVQCIAITWAEDDAGNEIVTPEFGDVIVTPDERRARLLAQVTQGSLRGRALLPPAEGGAVVSSPTGPAGGSFAPMAQQQPVPPFERDPAVTEASSWPYRFQVSGTLFEVGVLLAVARGSDTDVDVDVDGDTFTVTVPAGEVYATKGGLHVTVTKNTSEMVVTCTDTGFYLQVTPRVT